MTTYLNKEVIDEILRPITIPNNIVAGGSYLGIYMRPNLTSGNSIPVGGNVSECPDIWPSGPTPIPNFQTALASDSSYQTQSPLDIVLQDDNYIYVRGANGGANPLSVNVTLYYAPSALIQHPSFWSRNVLLTDQNNSMANINNLAPQGVGVADQTFVWPQVQPPPSGSDHYCLIAQFNDAQNSNPLPDPSTQLDLASLVSNNLGWGWHNISLVSAPAGFAFSFSTSLSIAQNQPAAYYSIVTTPVGYIGWQISYECSQSDSNGNPIELGKSQIIHDGNILGGNAVFLQPGFNALLTINMYNDNNVSAQPNANVPVSASYPTTTVEEFTNAFYQGLIDWKTTDHLRKLHPHGIQPGIPIHGAVILGSVTGKNPNP